MSDRLTDKQIAELSPIERRKATSNRNINDRRDGLRGNLDARQKRLENGLIRDLRELGQNEQPPTLRREEPRGNIPPRRGYSEVNLQPGTGEGQGTAGIASPLIEGATPPEADPGNPGAPTADKPKLEREYYPVAAIPSSDGIFTLSIRPLKRIALRDANGGQVVIQLAAPEELVAPEVSE